MAFCKYSTEYVASSKTEVDNIFMDSFLPFADPVSVKVYLYGLYKCSSPSSFDNSLESFAKTLNMSEDEVVGAFEYWQEQGLVQVLKTSPIEVRYIPLKNVITSNKLYKPEKYCLFNSQAQEIFEGKREISKTEYGEYYDFLERYHMEQEALLMIMKYCVDSKKSAVGYNYILTVAKNWASEGITTALQVEERLSSFKEKSDLISELFKAVGIKRNAYIEERELLDKWLSDYGFDMGTLVYIAKKIKKYTSFNLDKLDQIATKYYQMKLMTIPAIEEFENQKKALYDLAKDINKTLGLYYESLESVVENYVVKWLNLGYEKEVLLEIASYCFKKSIRTLEGMDKTVGKLYKLGIISMQALSQYLDSILKTNQKIEKLLQSLSIARHVNYIDRENYETWTNEWNMPENLIEYGATLAKGKDNPMRYLSRVLADWHSKGISSIEEAKNNLPAENTIKPAPMLQGRSYSKEDINALFESIDDVEI